MQKVLWVHTQAPPHLGRIQLWPVESARSVLSSLPTHVQVWKSFSNRIHVPTVHLLRQSPSNLTCYLRRCEYGSATNVRSRNSSRVPFITTLLRVNLASPLLPPAIAPPSPSREQREVLLPPKQALQLKNWVSPPQAPRQAQSSPLPLSWCHLPWVPVHKVCFPCWWLRALLVSAPLLHSCPLLGWPWPKSEQIQPSEDELSKVNIVLLYSMNTAQIGLRIWHLFFRKNPLFDNSLIKLYFLVPCWPWVPFVPNSRTLVVSPLLLFCRISRNFSVVQLLLHSCQVFCMKVFLSVFCTPCT